MSRPFLIVEAGGTLFGLEQALIREIVPARMITRLPGAPAAVRGLLNVRGTLVTVVDLAVRFGAGRTANDDASVVVAASQSRSLGLLVDEVHDVQSFADDALLPSPAELADAAIAGLGHFGERIVLAVELHELARQTLA